MPRACTTCRHKERATIEKALIEGASLRDLAKGYDLSVMALQRHKDNHLPEALTKAAEAQEAVRSVELMAELQRCFSRVNLLFDACDRWLRDADDPSRYDIGPRSEDVTVTYTETTEGGKQTRRKEKLSRLLERVSASGRAIEWTEVKHADPRELVLKTAHQLEGQIELLARLLGELDERPQVNILFGSEWVGVRSAVLSALAPFPDARAAVAAALIRMDTTYGHSN